ncbi:uncharacterized protein LOC113359680 [Papaver somniferum]|uniref:uncharacterized protein LOC113359680 n=1 Tax=Papaver somniferum TaxID=3469 RepID=UPI000E6F61F7|nr:uncharacterized protein LOC113359680 [Papaver somniferum]
MNHPPIPQNESFIFYGEVVELMLPDTIQWNITLPDQLFDDVTSRRIQSLFINKTKKDVIIWMPAKYGKFLVKAHADYGVLNPKTSMHKIQYYLAPHLHETAYILGTQYTDNHLHWKTPLCGTMKINVDASFDLDTNQLGIGFVLRDHAGTCNGIKGSYANGALSAEAGECMAVRESLSWEREKQLDNIHIEADSKLVIQSMEVPC